MDVSIVKEDTGYLSVIERPQATSSHASASGRRSSSTGSHTPEVPDYTEPLSEGEDDEYDGVLAPAKDEGRRTGLSGAEVHAAIAYREQMLKERREEEQQQSQQSQSNGDRNGKARATGEETLSGNTSDAGDHAESPSPRPRRPKYTRDRSTIVRRLKTKALAIDPLAPSSAFDETLKDKLHNAKEEEQKQGNGTHTLGNASGEEGTQRPDIAEEEAAMAGPSKPPADDRILDRSWHAPEGKKIAVPVRIEPKVYFAAERTFLVSYFVRRYFCISESLKFRSLSRSHSATVCCGSHVLPT